MIKFNYLFKKSFFLAVFVMTKSAFATGIMALDTKSDTTPNVVGLKIEACVASSKSDTPECGGSESPAIYKMSVTVPSGKTTPLDNVTVITGNSRAKTSETEGFHLTVTPAHIKNTDSVFTVIRYTYNTPGKKANYIIGSQELLLRPGIEQTVKMGNAEDLKYYITLKASPIFE